jgi:hypothetical protein
MQKFPRQDQAHKAQSSAAKPPNSVMSGPLQPLSAALGEQVAALERRAEQALRVLDLVRMALPEPEKSHVLSAGYRDDVLIVTLDSAAWTAHVRYREAALRRHLTVAGEKPFTHLKVRVGRPDG